MRFSPITVHELEGAELRVKLFYFLRDLGIRSSQSEANDAFAIHMNLLCELAGNR
jgi:hypothetical protein